MSKERNGFGKEVGGGGVRKRLVVFGRDSRRKAIAVGEMFLLVSMSFAFVIKELAGGLYEAGIF